MYLKTLIARLLSIPRRAVLAIRMVASRFIPALAPASNPEYVYEADGLATVHFSPFLHDEQYGALYSEMAAEWFVDVRADARWRMWILTTLARECASLSGSVAEFGVYRAGCAYMMLATSAIPPPKHLFLFDTFTGIPADALTESEIAAGLSHALTNTSTKYVAKRLSKWQSQITLVEGDVFQTLEHTETGPLSFVHMDLNAAAPTLHALQYAYPRLVAGAVMIFDDYGWKGLEAQRSVVDEYFSTRPEAIVALPTGQGMLIKR